jgi:hypothetical protein
VRRQCSAELCMGQRHGLHRRRCHHRRVDCGGTSDDEVTSVGSPPRSRHPLRLQRRTVRGHTPPRIVVPVRTTRLRHRPRCRRSTSILHRWGHGLRHVTAIDGGDRPRRRSPQ